MDIDSLPTRDCEFALYLSLRGSRVEESLAHSPRSNHAFQSQIKARKESNSWYRKHQPPLSARFFSANEVKHDHVRYLLAYRTNQD